MSAARPLALAFLSAAAAACTCSTAPAPVLLAVDPPEWPQGLGASLRILGSGFAAEVRADFDDPGDSSVDGTFRAALVAGDERVELTDVRLVSGEELHATLPAGAGVEVYDLEVVDPRGRAALLVAAFAVFEAECLEMGAPCDDGDLCTTGDTCQAWRCLPEAEVVCTPVDQCQNAACNRLTGLCSEPAEDGTPCSAGCPVGDTCRSGTCTPAPGGCQNTAPLARLTASPGGGTTGETLFALDASASSDAEDPPGSLQFRFDADGDGSWDGGLSPVPFLDHVYATPGTYAASVEVRDAGGLSGFATVLVLVAAAGDEVRVTTAVDERDPAATPSAPGGTGLSLREAVAWVNGLGAAKTITLAAPLTIAMAGAQRDLSLTAPGAAVVGEPGVTLDFGGFNQTCFRLDGPGQRLAGVTLAGCTSVYVQMTDRSQGSQVALLTIDAPDWRAIGVNAQADPLPAAQPSSLIGPGNDLSGLATGVNLLGLDYAVVGNRLHRNEVGARAFGGRASFLRNVFARQIVAPNAGMGLRIYTGAGPVDVLHNVFDRNDASGLESDNVADLEVRNNLFTWNDGHGLSARAAGLTLGPNGYVGNTLGPVSAELSTGPTDVLADPLYVDGPGGDHRLLPASPAVDAGLDTGLDVNGLGEGSWFGASPDLGAAESPY